MARKIAHRTVNVRGLGATKIVAEYDGGMYINLRWFNEFGPIMEVINVYDYRAGKIEEFNTSAELTGWLRENGSPATLANYFRNTA